MAGGGHGQGGVNMNQAEHDALINARVVEALAAYQAGKDHPIQTMPILNY